MEFHQNSSVCFRPMSTTTAKRVGGEPAIRFPSPSLTTELHKLGSVPYTFRGGHVFVNQTTRYEYEIS